MKRLQLLIVLWLGCLAVMQASSDLCYNPASNSLIPVDGTYTTMVDVVSDTTGIEVSYVLGTITLVDDNLFPGSKQLKMTGFGQSYMPGTPWVPMRADTYRLQGNMENFKVEILSAESVEFPLDVAPARRMLLEQEASASSPDEVEPISDCEFGSTDSIAKIIQIGGRSGNPVVSVLVRPIQYDSTRKVVRVYKEFTYRLSYDYAPAVVEVDGDLGGALRPYVKNSINLSYLVIGPSEYQEVVGEFVEWKRRCGYKVIERFSESWTSQNVKQTIDSVYNAQKGLDYVLLLGDHNVVPGQQYTQYFSSTGTVTYVSDFGYSCVDEDYVSDLYIGRIPGKTIADVQASLDKILTVEKSPSRMSSFYQNYLLNGYFQIEGDIQRTSRRFVETCEDVRDYVSQFGVNGIRNYYAENRAQPKYWSSTYGTGDEIPQELQRPEYEWKGDASTINQIINEGCNIVFTRTHGSVDGWSAPKYAVDDMSGLKKVPASCYPIICSLSCNTGNYASSKNGLCQTLMSKPLSGCVAALGATQASFTTLNDAYAHGIVNLLWPEPGLFKPLTNEPVPSMGISSKYGPTLGEALESANLRMDELAPLPELYRLYQKRLYHIFGDPSMWINTSVPTNIEMSGGLYYDGTASSDVFRLSVGDEKCLIAIVDGLGRQYACYDTEIELRNSVLPLDITVTGHNKIPAMMTYYKPDTTGTLPLNPPYKIDKVVVDDDCNNAMVYVTRNEELKSSMEKQTYGLMVFSSNGTPIYSSAIDIKSNVHNLPVGRWRKADEVTAFIVALTNSGAIIDAKTFFVKYH